MGSGTIDSRELKQHLERTRHRMRRAVEQAPRAAAEQTLRHALELVPRRTGALAASGQVELLPGGAAAVVFGGPSAPYAWVVHQSPDLVHATGQWQYLTSAPDVDLLVAAAEK